MSRAVRGRRTKLEQRWESQAAARARGHRVLAALGLTIVCLATCFARTAPAP